MDFILAKVIIISLGVFFINEDRSEDILFGIFLVIVGCMWFVVGIIVHYC